MAILIDNFSVGVEEWLVVIDLVSFAVDVVDHIHGITTSGTYFLHDGQIVPTSYSGISGGYRCSYYPTDVCSSGTITITIHAENNNSETKEEDYYLLCGYHVEFEELIDWGPKKEVVITMDAKNLAFCPNTETEAFYFETAELHSRDLNATLQAVEYVDLNATIYPQSTAFFYERTYTIIISGIRDFAGNEMVESIFSFTIENE